MVRIREFRISDTTAKDQYIGECVQLYNINIGVINISSKFIFCKKIHTDYVDVSVKICNLLMGTWVKQISFNNTYDLYSHR